MKISKKIKDYKVQLYSKMVYKYCKLKCGLQELNSPVSNEKLSLKLPLIYISQSARNGGTLTRNLFDGHSKILSLPHELSWEKNGFHWQGSIFEGVSRRDTLNYLFDHWIYHFKLRGLDKKYPFNFSVKKMKKNFYHFKNVSSPREYCDLYLSSFFLSWENFYSDFNKRKYFLAFCPQILNEQNIDAFYDIYPDGYRVQVVREPKSWWASEKQYGIHKGKKNLDEYFEKRWLNPVKLGLKSMKKHPDRYLLLSNQALTVDTEKSMTELLRVFDLKMEQICLSPTYNAEPRESNSSFSETVTSGINTAAGEKWKSVLTQSEINEIDKKATPLYKSVLENSVN